MANGIVRIFNKQKTLFSKHYLELEILHFEYQNTPTPINHAVIGESEIRERYNTKGVLERRVVRTPVKDVEAKDIDVQVLEGVLTIKNGNKTLFEKKYDDLAILQFDTKAEVDRELLTVTLNVVLKAKLKAIQIEVQ